MNTNFSVYTRGPTIPAYRDHLLSTKSSRREGYDGSYLAQKIRKNLYSGNPDKLSEVRTSKISNAQRKKIARDHILSALFDQNIIDQDRIVDNLVNWCVRNDYMDEIRARDIYENAIITTDSNPARSTFRIRIKL